jgi:hypothetical protein
VPSGLTLRRSAAGATLDWSAPVVPGLVGPTAAASEAPSQSPPPSVPPTSAPVAPASPAASPPGLPAGEPGPDVTPPPASPSPAPAEPGPTPSPETIGPENAAGSPSPAPAPSPSASASPAAPTSGFWVYRRTATGRYASPLSPAPVAAPPFEDREVSAETVCYVVRTVVATEPLVESAESNEVCAPPEMPAPSPGA